MMKRGSGVLMHVTSLPSPFGIGDLGPGAYDFVNFLAEARQG
ncbi:MAG: 4-alpha-glucanotransferase, partial [Pseudomonadota bacterium]